MSYDLDKIRALLTSPEGVELMRFLEVHLTELDSIQNIPMPEHPYAKAVALEAQRTAYHKLARILSQLGVITGSLPQAPQSRDYAM